LSKPIVAQDVEPEVVDWLWHDRNPRSMISVVAGRPDQGKGLFAAVVAADVSRAGGRVLYSAAEDSHGLVTRPRLEAAGADLDNILLWRFALPVNFDEVAEIVADCRSPLERRPLVECPLIGPRIIPNPAHQPDPVPVDLIVMDPFASHLSNGISRHSDNVRSVLGPLTDVIETTGTAVLVVEHALKRAPQDGHVLNAIGGAGSGLPAASRTAYVFGVDPDDEDARILAPAKFNIGPKPKALRLEVDTEDLETVGEIPFLAVDQELAAFDPMRLFESKSQPGKVGRPPEKRAAAAEWLTNYLAQAGGPVLSSTIQEHAKHYGMSVKTLRRAADDMGVVKTPPGGGRHCTWDLNDDVKDAMGLAQEAAEVGSDQDAVDQLLASIEKGAA
jgi:hypothetical protein